MKNVLIKASTVDAEFEFSTSSKVTGKELFDEVSRYIGMREVWFFGLFYIDCESNNVWIDVSEKKISTFNKENTLAVKYSVKYYPEDVENDLMEDLTIKQFFYKVRSDIYSDRIYCPADICVLLSSYALQARYGNFNKNVHTNEFINMEKLPKRVYEQHSISKEEWIANIISVWEKHEGILPEDAMMEYLKEVEKLDMFGIHYFDITNRNDSPLYLGIGALGLNIYRDQKLKPEIAFQWSEIKQINFSNKKFTIQTFCSNPGDTTYFYFFTKNDRINKEIYNLSVGYHEMHIRRRKPNSPDVVQMKLLAQRKKLYRKQMTENFRKEVIVRKNLETKYEEYERNLLDLEKALHNKQSSLVEAQSKIGTLQNQLKNLQVVVDESAKEEKELEKTVQNLKVMQDQRETEINMLRMELLSKKEMLEIKREIEHLELNCKEEIKSDLQNQLEDLKQNLDQKLIKGNETDMDQIYKLAIEGNVDKYKTLREIRKADIKRRVEAFESL